MSAYRKILVAVDGSAPAAAGLKEAIRLAKSQEAQLIVFHLVNEFYAVASPEGLPAVADLMPMLRDEGRKLLAKAQALAEKAAVKVRTVMHEGFGGVAAESIVDEAKKQRADLIVLGTHGRRGLRRVVMGSDAEQVVRLSPVPVLLVRGGA